MAGKRQQQARCRTAFGGWPAAAIEFLEGIELENNKSYWTANKELYQSAVLAPMQALLSDLSADFGAGKVFRPYRDTRFSADKTPYKTFIAAHNNSAYITLSADALGVGTGLYMPASDQLLRFRAAVAEDRTGTELERLIADLGKDGIEVHAHEVLKSAPRGYKSDHPRIELLRHKGLTAWREWPVGPWLDSATPRERIEDFLRATAKLRKWINRNVGDSDAI
jgi:uncharacterized protein (TIGR02453 family)